MLRVVQAFAFAFAFAAAGCQDSAARGGAAEPPECVSCHLPDYRATTRPMHVGVRPTQCQVCHTQDAWSPSVLDHPWPLTGAHAKAACNDCHLGKPPKYEGTSKLCVSCHRDDYDGASYPGHAQFATSCDDCHSTTAFVPARAPARRVPLEPTPRKHAGRAHPQVQSTQTVQPRTAVPSEQPATQLSAPLSTPGAQRRHPEARFPISSGSHTGIECRTCHDQGGAMGKDDTDCVQCHSRARFDRKHRNVEAYPQTDAPPNFCVRCHTAGTVGSAR